MVRWAFSPSSKMDLIVQKAFYGIPAVLLAECRNRIAEGLMTDVLDEFDHVLGRDRNVESDDKEDNRTINQKNK